MCSVDSGFYVVKGFADTYSNRKSKVKSFTTESTESHGGTGTEAIILTEEQNRGTQRTRRKPLRT